jgi:hypothetical protein
MPSNRSWSETLHNIVIEKALALRKGFPFSLAIIRFREVHNEHERSSFRIAKPNPYDYFFLGSSIGST